MRLRIANSPTIELKVGSGSGKLITYDFDLAPVLIFGDLAATFLIQVGGIDLCLQVLDFLGLSAYFFDFLLFAVIDDPHLGKLTSQLLLHAHHVN